MKINKQYEIAKCVIVNYIAGMKELYEINQDVIDKYNNSIYDDEVEDLEVAIKFCRTWDIIMNDLSVSDRNLFILYQASDRNMKKALEYFNSIGKSYKNTATLTVIMCGIKKKIKEIYFNKYGIDCNI